MEKEKSYSTVIREVRKEKELSVEDLERITLTPNIERIEEGMAELTQQQLNLFANVLGLSSEALKQGIRKGRKDTIGELDAFMEQLIKEKSSETFFLEAIQELTKPEHFAAKYNKTSEKEHMNTGTYYIFDIKNKCAVTDKNGEAKTYASAIEALKAAVELEQSVEKNILHEKPEIKKNAAVSTKEMVPAL